MTIQETGAVDEERADENAPENDAARADRRPAGKRAGKGKSAPSRREKAASVRPPSKARSKGDARKRGGKQPGTKKQLRRRVRLLTVALTAAAVCLVVALAAVVWLAIGWSSDSDKVHSAQQAAGNAQHAEQLAADYTRRALNYSYQNPDQYLDAIGRDASPALSQKFNSARDLIKGVITQAHVVASGSVLSASLESVNDNNFHVIVVGQQTSQNDQNQQPITDVTPLRVTVSKNGSTWTVTEFGPLDSTSGGIPGAGGNGSPAAPSPAAGGN